MKENKKSIERLDQEIQELKENYGSMTHHAARSEINSLKKNLSEVLENTKKQEQQQKKEIEKTFASARKVRAQLNELEYNSEKFFQKESMLKIVYHYMAIFAFSITGFYFIGIIFLYFYIVQLGLVEFFPKILSEANGISFFTPIAIWIIFFQLAVPLYYIFRSHNPTKKSALRYSESILILTLSFLFSLSGYTLISSVPFSLTTSTIWIFSAILLRRLFIFIHDSKNHFLKRILFPFSIFIWAFSVYFSYSVFHISQQKTYTNFGKIFYLTGFTQLNYSWQRISDSYFEKQKLTNEEKTLFLQDFQHNEISLPDHFKTSNYLYGKLVINSSNLAVFCQPYKNPSYNSCLQFHPDELLNVTDWIEKTTKPSSDKDN